MVCSFFRFKSVSGLSIGIKCSEYVVCAVDHPYHALYTKDDKGRHLDGVVLSNVEGYRFIHANTYIDATGDAVLSELAGAQCLRAGQGDVAGIMPPTLCAQLDGIDWPSIEMRDASPASQSIALHQAIQDGFFNQPEYFVPSILRNCADSGTMNAGHIFDMDELDIQSISKGMVLGRKLVQEYIAYYRKYVRGFENARILSTGPLMGVRESRRIIGEYTLCYEDYISRRKFPNQIGIYTNGIDVHPYKNLAEEQFIQFRREHIRPEVFGDGESYGIPYGVIVLKGFTNLWTAGRCSSSDRLVNSSMRVQPICSVLGQAAGTAAFLYATTGDAGNTIDISQLQKLLLKQGAVLN